MDLAISPLEVSHFRSLATLPRPLSFADADGSDESNEHESGYGD